jgi:hypothetical protein
LVLSGCLVTGLAGAADITSPGARTSTPQAAPAVNSSNAPILAATRTEPDSLATNTFTSLWVLEVARLIRARIDPDVILAYIDNTPGTFNLGAEQIIDLTYQGASSELINAMLEHDRQIHSGLLPVTSSTVPVPNPSPFAQRLTEVPTPSESGPSPEIKELSAKLKRDAAAHPFQPAPAVLVSPPCGSIAVLSDAPDPDWAALLAAAEDDVPEQPDCLYRVRLPYPVKLTDPIIVFHSPGD